MVNDFFGDAFGGGVGDFSVNMNAGGQGFNALTGTQKPTIEVELEHTGLEKEAVDVELPAAIRIAVELVRCVVGTHGC